MPIVQRNVDLVVEPYIKLINILEKNGYEIFHGKGFVGSNIVWEKSVKDNYDKTHSSKMMVQVMRAYVSKWIRQTSLTWLMLMVSAIAYCIIALIESKLMATQLVTSALRWCSNMTY